MLMWCTKCKFVDVVHQRSVVDCLVACCLPPYLTVTWGYHLIEPQVTSVHWRLHLRSQHQCDWGGQDLYKWLQHQGSHVWQSRRQLKLHLPGQHEQQWQEHNGQCLCVRECVCVHMCLCVHVCALACVCVVERFSLLLTTLASLVILYPALSLKYFTQIKSAQCTINVKNSTD